ncbi:MAG TPA: YfbM family protein [Polyangiaceae bacterium]|nr:YfbM family protein [Polyangiaceae bacterium]
MGMIANFRRLPEVDLLCLREDPERVSDYLGEGSPTGEFGPFADLDVDKAWHAIHFLLTGSAWEGESPLNFIAAGGAEIGDDVGYGPARCLDSSEVASLAAALQELPTNVLLKRFNPEALSAADIYPDIWDRPPEEDDSQGYVAEYYEVLRSFILDAASEHQALLVSIS